MLHLSIRGYAKHLSILVHRLNVSKAEGLTNLLEIVLINVNENERKLLLDGIFSDLL